MGTGVAAGSVGRQYPQQMTHYLRKTINYNDTGIGADATVKVGDLPAGAVVLWTLVKVRTAFNAANTNTIDVGTSADDDALVDGGAGDGTGDVDATVAEAQYVYRGGDLAVPTVDTTIYVTYVQTGTAATAGIAEIIVAFIPDNDR